MCGARFSASGDGILVVGIGIAFRGEKGGRRALMAGAVVKGVKSQSILFGDGWDIF